MMNKIEIHVRRFPVVIRDERTGDIRDDSITLSKEQLQAAQLVGESSTELIHRMYNRKGYRVLEISTPNRHSITLNLEELVRQYQEHQEERGKWSYLYGGGAK